MSTAPKQRTIAEIPVQFVKGMGEKRAEAFRKFQVETVEDLLEFIPRRYLDRSTISPIAKVQLNEEATVIGEVISTEVVTRGKRRLIVRIYDRSGVLEGVWFNQIDLFKRIFSVGQTVAFSGKVGRYRHWQMVHPDFDILSQSREPLHTSQIIPIYPGSETLKKVGLNSYAGLLKTPWNSLEHRFRKPCPPRCWKNTACFPAPPLTGPSIFRIPPNRCNRPFSVSNTKKSSTCSF